MDAGSDLGTTFQIKPKHPRHPRRPISIIGGEPFFPHNKSVDNIVPVAYLSIVPVVPKRPLPPPPQLPVMTALERFYTPRGIRVNRDADWTRKGPIPVCAVCDGTKNYHGSVQSHNPHPWQFGRFREDLLPCEKGPHGPGGIALIN
jgi:hypothetical protein